jgi:pSer/pThr/pTyr-binding forkhead associated (FHA) protein
MTDDQNEVSTLEPVESTEAAPDAEAASAANLAKLVVKRNGAETDVVFPVNSPCVIGRFDPAVGPIDIDLAGIPEGAYVSRKHAKIEFEGDAWMIHDLGSSNGTFVLHDDFERVEISEISDGTEIALGNARFVFHLAHS